MRVLSDKPKETRRKNAVFVLSKIRDNECKISKNALWRLVKGRMSHETYSAVLCSLVTAGIVRARVDPRDLNDLELKIDPPSEQTLRVRDIVEFLDYDLYSASGPFESNPLYLELFSSIQWKDLMRLVTPEQVAWLSSISYDVQSIFAEANKKLAEESYSEKEWTFLEKIHGVIQDLVFHKIERHPKAVKEFLNPAAVQSRSIRC